MRQVEEMVRAYIAENMLFSDDGYPHSGRASILEEGIIDSMDIMELVMFVEENFDITVEDEELTPEHLDSVSRLAAYIRRKAPSLAAA